MSPHWPSCSSSNSSGDTVTPPRGSIVPVIAALSQCPAVVMPSISPATCLTEKPIVQPSPMAWVPPSELTWSTVVDPAITFTTSP